MSEGMSTAFVDGCCYNRKGNLKSGAGVVWLNNGPCPTQQLKLGPQSSQYAEIAAILITLQLATFHNIKELICTDYAHLSFTCHLAGWKRNGFKTANNKPVKHQELFQASDAIVTQHDMIVYWKKVRGHSCQPEQDKDFNDQTDALAKAESPGHFMPSHPTLQWQQKPAASMPLAGTPLPPPTLPYHLSSPLMISSPSKLRIRHYELWQLTFTPH